MEISSPEIGDVLSDKRKNKKKSERPWIKKKRFSQIVAKTFNNIGQTKRGQNIFYCGTELEFARSVEDNSIFLTDANFCRQRLCPMCQWRRSLKVFHQVSQVYDRLEELHPDLQPIFLTLTVRNVPGQELENTIDDMFKAWNRVTCNDRFKPFLSGWFRAMEVTYNHQAETFHPHFHVIMFLKKDYFKKSNHYYMDNPTWSGVWRKAMRLDYDPIVNVKKVRKSKDKKIVAEVSKYTVKESDFITQLDDSVMEDVVGWLHRSLYRRRLYSFGGVLRTIARDLKQDELGEGSLITIDREKIRNDLAYIIEKYQWDFGCNKYLRQASFF